MFLKSCLKKILRQERGVIIAMTAVMIPLVFGFAGLAYDVGNLYVQKGKLQHIADSAALAGAAVYRDIATDSTTSGTISADDPTDINNTTFISTRPSNLANTNHGEADAVAWDYVEKNKGTRVIGVNGPFALHGAVTAQTSEGTVTTKPEDGVYYRVLLAEEVPLNFLPLLPGIGRTQTVNAESIVALSTEQGTEAHTDVHASTEYVPIFDKMFSYNNLSGSVVPETTSNDLIYSATNQINLRHYSFMLYMNHQWSNSSADINNTLLSSNGNAWSEAVTRWVSGQVLQEDNSATGSWFWIEYKYDTHRVREYYDENGQYHYLNSYQNIRGYYKNVTGHYETIEEAGFKPQTGSYSLNGYYLNNNSHYTEDMYYKNKLTEKLFVNVKLESRNDVTINLNEDLDNPYYYYDGLNYILNGTNYYRYATNALNSNNGVNTNGWTSSGGKKFRNGYYNYSTRNNTLGTNINKAFPVPLYIYREASHKTDKFKDTIINVTGNTNTSCYPIVLYQYNKFDATETKVEINISNGMIFRGVIFAPDSLVKINTNDTGTFEGSIIGKRVETSGAGPFLQKNFFKNEVGEDADWYINYNGLNYGENNSILYNYDSASGKYLDTYTEQQLRAFLYDGNFSFEQQLIDRVSNVTHYNSEGEASGTDKDISWYNSLNTRPQYAMFSQEWFEHLLVEEKARLAYFWNYYYQGDMPWLWAREADSTYTVPVSATAGLKAFRLINSRTETNPFGNSN